MKNPVETLISTIAPHRCIGCKCEGTLLCESCASVQQIAPPSRCYHCHKATKQSQVCASCKPRTKLSHAWVATEYDELTKKLIHKLKFERARSAADVVAREIDEVLPILPAEVVVCHVPTANTRVRVRGYDQSKLIAVSLAKRRQWRHMTLLRRIGSTRQVGSDRKTRLSQLEGAFKVTESKLPKYVLLIDDVLTTGASVEAAAKKLRNAGVKTIDAAVFTQPME